MRVSPYRVIMKYMTSAASAATWSDRERERGIEIGRKIWRGHNENKDRHGKDGYKYESKIDNDNNKKKSKEWRTTTEWGAWERIRMNLCFTRFYCFDQFLDLQDMKKQKNFFSLITHESNYINIENRYECSACVTSSRSFFCSRSGSSNNLFVYDPYMKMKRKKLIDD